MKTALDATKQTYAWRFKSGSIHKLREPAEIEPFCGPWGEASLRDLDYADTPLPMYDQMTLSLVPRRTSRKRAARQQPAVERHRDVVVEPAEEPAEEPAVPAQPEVPGARVLRMVVWRPFCENSNTFIRNALKQNDP